MLPGDQVVNKLIKLPLNVEESDLRLLCAVLNASMTDIPLENITPELLDKVMRSGGAAASLVPVILDFVQETLRHQGSTNMAVYGQSRLLGLSVEQNQEFGGLLAGGHVKPSVVGIGADRDLAVVGNKVDLSNTVHPGQTDKILLGGIVGKGIRDLSGEVHEIAV